VRNCTVVSNTYTSGAGVWLKTYNYKTPAPWNNDHHVHLYNTIFAGNYATVDSSTVGGNEYMMPTGLVDQARLEACYTNCAFTAPHAPGANAVQLDSVEEARFRSWNRDDYRLKSSSPCHKTGFYQSWMEGAVDLNGEPRIKQYRKGVPLVDIGCYESDPSVGLMMIVR